MPPQDWPAQAADIPDATENVTVVERVRLARRVLTIAALLGILADVALRNAPDGLGWTLWVFALGVAALDIARRRGQGLSREELAWLGEAVACAITFAWRDAEALRVANIFATLVALSMFSMSATGLPAVSILAARLRDVLAAGIYAFRDVVAGAPILVVRDASLHTLPAVTQGTSWTALRAVLITAPLVLIFALLLSSADPVFASIFELTSFDFEEAFSHVVIVGAFAWWSAGWMRGALLGVAHRGTIPDRMPLQLGMAEITSALGAVIVLFAIFVSLQLRWLFGGAEVVLATTGLTIAEYARRGFFELVAVSALVLPLILVTRAFIEDERVIRRHRQLSLMLVVLLGAIITSAMMRMSLYVGYFGLTTDRVYATALMGWLAVVFVALAFTVLRGRPRLFASMTVLSGFLTILVLNALNPDLMVARVNLGRVTAERGVDYEYLARLSGDAVPTVVKALNSAAPSPEACKAADALRSRWQPPDVASWNLGDRRGRAAVLRDLPAAEARRLCLIPSSTP